MKKPIIYTSKHLSIDSNTKSVAKGIIDALKELHVEHRELETTEKNYWCRDYMPVKISDDGCYSRFIYKPDYLVAGFKFQMQLLGLDYEFVALQS